MRSLTTLLILLAATPLGTAGSLKAGQTKVLSWKPGNPPLQASSDPAISRNGRFVAFSTNEADLGGWTSNGKYQIVLFDRRNDQMEWISRGAGNAPANDDCHRPDISDSGRYVVYYSRATNLAGGDPGDRIDVFRYDRKLKVTARTSITYNGLFGNGDSYRPSISGDGQTVAFRSYATNMVAESNNGVGQLYAHDFLAGSTFAVSAGPGGLLGDGASHAASLSKDGRLAAYQSIATNLGPSPGFQGYHIYVKDLQTGANTLVSRGHQGQAADNSSYSPRISGDGQFVAFTSRATNLTARDRGSFEYADLFVYDRRKDRMKEFVAKRGRRHYHNEPAALSTNGRFILVESTREIYDEFQNLVDTEAILHLVDARSGRITVESVNSQGRRARGHCGRADLSGNGRYLSFFSDAKNLGRDRDELPDVFLRRRG